MEQASAADQRLLERRPFDKKRASRIVYSTDYDNLDEFYTLPYE